MGGCNLFFFFESELRKAYSASTVLSEGRKENQQKINRSIDPLVTQTKGTANPIILIPGLVQLLQHS